MYNGIIQKGGVCVHPNISEALRYLGVRNAPDGSLRTQMAALSDELIRQITPRWAWRMLPLDHGEACITLSGTDILLSGSTAGLMLQDCHYCAVLVCTLGSVFDAWLQREQSRNMPRAVMLDALGSAYVEAACDAAEQEIAARFPGQFLTDRFSPGYGDLPLDIQPQLLDATDAHRRLGIYTASTHLMTPIKSVTALIGIADKPQMARIRGCAHCSMKHTCTLRKAGKACEL